MNHCKMCKRVMFARRKTVGIASNLENPCSAQLRTRHQCAFWWGHMDDPASKVCQNCRHIDTSTNPPPATCPLRKHEPIMPAQLKNRGQCRDYISEGIPDNDGMVCMECRHGPSAMTPPAGCPLRRHS